LIDEKSKHDQTPGSKQMDLLKLGLLLRVKLEQEEKQQISSEDNEIELSYLDHIQAPSKVDDLRALKSARVLRDKSGTPLAY
jgi:hypothetical protein